ncbi:CHAT domain-containing tetratricopeptide repeat protein [Massilia sp. S19_KUP03_FR1]|uniref:CHAT domain-containing tetratricopeptide repeat protein n=1 Tax=Massilia sp. S19_KUP03_FR1 TaxID=3025503 RepID=UPI002FCDC990
MRGPACSLFLALAMAAGLAHATCLQAAAALIDSGDLAVEQERYQDAVAPFEQALALCRAAADRSGISASLLAYGKVLDVLHRYPESEAVLLEGWALRQAIDASAQPDGDPGRERMYYPAEMMYLYRSSSRFDLAWKWGDVALQAKAQLAGATSSSYGTSLSNMSGIALQTREYARGLVYARQAMDIWEKTSGTDSTDHAWGMRDVGMLLLRQGKLPESHVYLERAYQIRLAAFGQDRTETQTSTRDLAIWHTAAGNDVSALAFAEAGLASAVRRDGAQSLAASYALAGVGSIHLRLGEARQAAAEAEQVLAIRRAVLGEQNAQTINAWQDLAQAQLANNRLGRAAQASQAALAACRAMPGRIAASCVTHQINHARILLALGQPDAALQDAEQAAALARATDGEMPGDERAAGMLAAQALRALGRQQDAETALVALERRVAATPEPVTNGLFLVQLALLAVRADAPGQDTAQLASLAAESAALAEALAQQRGRAHPDYASALLDTAALNARASHTTLARQQSARALAIALANRATLLQARASAQLSVLDAGAQAVFFGKQAVNALQSARENIVGLPTEQQHSFIHLQKSAYQQLVDQLLDRRRIGEAETVLALVEENEFHELLRGADGAPAQDARVAQIDFEQAEESARHSLAERTLALQAAAAALADARAQQARGVPGGAALVASAQATLAALIDQATGLFAASVPVAASAAEPKPLPRRTTLAPGQLHLTYLVGAGRLRIVVQQGATVRVVSRAIDEAALVRQIALLRRTAQDPGQDPRAAAGRLYTLLVGPVQAELAQARSLTLSLGGALRYVPFAMLHDGRGYLVERLPVQLASGAGKVAPARPLSLALFGQSQASGDLPALPYVASELLAVAGSGRIPHRSYLDARFTAANLAQGLQQASMVHIAGHFVLRSGRGDDSYLLLGNGERLSLTDLAQERFRFDGLDLLTLSACETAVPAGVDANGRELASLAWLARERGARHVLASLWRVSDRSTATLMTDFYQALARGENHGAALRLAQLHQIRNPARAGAGTRGLRPLGTQGARIAGHPFYWAGFMLLGN